MDKYKIALKIVNPVKKVRMRLNLINTKDGRWIPVSKKNHKPSTQIRTEFLKDPKFRIYFVNKDNDLATQQSLAKMLKYHKTHFTVSLGLSELLAYFHYIGDFNAEQGSDIDFVELQTIIPSSKLVDNELEIEPGKKYFNEKMPIVMNTERVIERYEDIIFESDGKPIKAKVENFYRP